MGMVILDISMSLDGFVNAANVRPEEPMGDGGLRLYEWALDSDDDRNREVLIQGANETGAIIAGRRTYDASVPWWGADGPTGPTRLPVFVVNHNMPKQIPDKGVYTFVSDGIDRPLQEAKTTAGDKNVPVKGSAEVAQQYIQAGLVDEISIHLVPVPFGSGTCLFDHLGGGHIQLEIAKIINTAEAIHLRFRVIK